MSSMNVSKEIRGSIVVPSPPQSRFQTSGFFVIFPNQLHKTNLLNGISKAIFFVIKPDWDLIVAKNSKPGKEEPLEKKPWKAADKLRKNMDAAEYKHIALGLQ